MRRFAILASIALSGCASDVVLKPAVIGFVGDSRTAAAAINQSYDSLVADTNRNAALLLAANPECGMNVRPVVRIANDEVQQVLSRPQAQAVADALATRLRIKRHAVPGDTYCISAFELQVAEKLLGKDFQDLPVRSVPLFVLRGDEFAPQRAAVDALTAYVASLAELADDPELTAQADLKAVVAKLKLAAGDAKSIAEAVKLDASLPRAAQAALSDGGAVDGYVAAVGALANSIELIVDQNRDVAALRAKLLSPDNDIEARIRDIGAKADIWFGQASLNRQNALMSQKAGVAEEVAALPFERRAEAMQAFVGSYAATQVKRRSPYGAMTEALAVAHADLRRIAEGRYTPDERRVLIRATLERLGDTLKAIAGVAAKFA